MHAVEPKHNGGALPHLARADAVHDWIADQIMSGTLEPGAHLRITQLASAARVSHTPVREALARLEGTGLVNRLPLRGYVVAPPLSRDDLRNLTAVRELLEPEITALACENNPPDLVASLEANQAAAHNAPTGAHFTDYRPYLDSTSDFHAILGNACGNPFLLKALGALPVFGQRFRLFGEAGVTDAEISIAAHQQILEAVSAHDVEGARAAMRAHIEAVYGRAALSVNLQ